MRLEYIEFQSGDARKKSAAGPTEIDTNITMESVNAPNDKRLVVRFVYLALYRPDGSHVRLHGVASFSAENPKALVAEWKKTRNILGEPGEIILNSINYHSSISSVLVARPFNLVPPLTLPRVSFGKNIKPVLTNPSKNRKAKRKK